MTPTLMRVVLGLVVALALLDGVDCRPHSSTASDSALSVQNHDGDFSNRLGTHRHHHHRNNDHHHHHSRDQPESGAHAHADPVRQFLKTRIKLCGRRLAEALSAICAGKGYNSLDNDSGQSTPRYRGSVVTECCHEGCSLDDLEQYCQARKTPTSESDETAKTFDSTTNQIHQLFKVSTPASSQQPMENVEPTTASAEEREISARSTLTSQPSPRPSVEGARTLPDAELDDLLKHMIAVGTLPPRGGHPIIPRRHHPSAPNWLSSH